MFSSQQQQQQNNYVRRRICWLTLLWWTFCNIYRCQMIKCTSYLDNGMHQLYLNQVRRKKEKAEYTSFYLGSGYCFERITCVHGQEKKTKYELKVFVNETAWFLPPRFPQLGLYVQSIYTPFKVLKSCLKFHLESSSCSGPRHSLWNDGNHPKVTPSPVWWIIGGVKLKTNETVSPAIPQLPLDASWRRNPITLLAAPPRTAVWSPNALPLNNALRMFAVSWEKTSILLFLVIVPHQGKLRKNFSFVWLFITYTRKASIKNVSEKRSTFCDQKDQIYAQPELEKREKQWMAGSDVVFQYLTWFTKITFLSFPYRGCSSTKGIHISLHQVTCSPEESTPKDVWLPCRLFRGSLGGPR